MRTVAALSLLLAGALAESTDNFIAIEKGQVVGHGFAKSLYDMPSGRSTGSGDDNNIFNGVIGITDALNENSPLSQWLDDLLNPESDPYKQAVVDAMKILLTVLLMALGGLGVDTFTILVLGFQQGSVEVVYQVKADSVQASNAGLNAANFEAAVSNTVSDSGDSIEGFTIDQSSITIEDSTTVVTEAECADCWVAYDSVSCIPDPNRVALSCNPDGMVLSVDTCVMGLTNLASLSLNDANCNGGTSILETTNDLGYGNGDRPHYTATTALDGCSTAMSFVDTHIEFTNHLVGNFDASQSGPDSIINTYDRYSVGFTCDYATTYDDIGTTTNVTGSTNSGPIPDGQGSLAFTLETYTSDAFDEKDTSGVVRVGTTLNFAVEISQPIANVDFTVTDCTVSNGAKTLSYDILTNGCPNNRVNFDIKDNRDSEMTKFSYTVFEFKNDDAATLHLSCNIVVCQADKDDSTCAQTPTCGRRRRRSFDQSQTYYRVAADLTSV